MTSVTPADVAFSTWGTPFAVADLRRVVHYTEIDQSTEEWARNRMLTDRMRIGDRLVRWINERPKGVALGFTTLFIAVALAQAANKVFWFDELITVHIARLGSVSGVWEALSRGTDPNPPLSHLLPMWSTKFLGQSEVAYRLPAILAGWLGALSVFVFLRRRMPPIFALIGVLGAMVTFAFNYSYEARSYAFMVGFAASAVVCWQSIFLNRRRTLALLGLALSLAAGISSNYYAVLAFFPITAGELVRTIERRRIDWLVWAALAVGALPLLFYRKLIAVGIATFAPHAWNKPELSAVWDSYKGLLANMGWITIALVIAAAVLMWHAQSVGAPNFRVLSRPEAVAVATVVAYPLIGYSIAVARAGMFSPRFVVPLTIGFALAFGTLFYKVLHRERSIVLLATIALLFTTFVVRERKIYVRYARQRSHLAAVIANLPRTGAIVPGEPLLVLTAQYYAPEEAKRRIVYPLDFDAIHKWRGEDSAEQNLWAGKDFVFPVPLPSLEQFNREHPTYQIIGTRDNWLVQSLSDAGSPPKRLPIETGTQGIMALTQITIGELHFFERRIDKAPEQRTATLAP